MTTTYIGTNLRYFRKMAGLSQQGLAMQIGLNRGNIASYEKGAAEPSSTTLLKLSRFFQIDLVDFIEHDLSQSNPSMVGPTYPSRGSLPPTSSHSAPHLLPQPAPAALDPLQPIQQSLDNTAHILHGFKAYHQTRTQHLKHEDMEVRGLMLDFQRLLELAFDSLAHNRTLLERIDQLENRLSLEKSTQPSPEIPTLLDHDSPPQPADL